MSWQSKLPTVEKDTQDSLLIIWAVTFTTVSVCLIIDSLGSHEPVYLDLLLWYWCVVVSPIPLLVIGFYGYFVLATLCWVIMTLFEYHIGPRPQPRSSSTLERLVQRPRSHERHDQLRYREISKPTPLIRPSVELAEATFILQICLYFALSGSPYTLFLGKVVIAIAVLIFCVAKWFQFQDRRENAVAAADSESRAVKPYTDMDG